MVVSQLATIDHTVSFIACLHDQKVACLDGRLFFSQSEQFKKYKKALIGWKKVGPPKKPLLF